MSRPTRSPTLLCGIDEAGRGPLAGPVCAAAVAFTRPWRGSPLDDSKKLSPDRRSALRAEIEAGAAREELVYGIGWASPREIERLNILQATFLAMGRAVGRLERRWEVGAMEVMVDGNARPPLGHPCTPVIGGDATVPEIMAASILAKTSRDRLMATLDQLFPGYEFSRHSGYPTPGHRSAIVRLGPSPVHRRTFAGVREYLLRDS